MASKAPKSPAKTPAAKSAAAAKPTAVRKPAANKAAARKSTPESTLAAAGPTAQQVAPAAIKPTTRKAAPPSKLKTAATALIPDPLAVAMLKEDHRAASALFKEFQSADRPRKLKIAREVTNALKVHTTIEEELFYPAIKLRIEDEMVNEAVIEHASAKDLIAQIDGMSGSEELFDAKVTVLGELIEHHVEEEETEMFKQAKAAGIDLDALGEQMQARKAALEADKSFSRTGWLKGLTGNDRAPSTGAPRRRTVAD